MAIRGRTANIAINPISYKDADPKENFIPVSIELRNGIVTDLGNFRKRPGYASWRDLSNGSSVVGLIPEDEGYAITETGKIYLLLSTPSELTGAIAGGGFSPTVANHDGTIIIARGGSPVKIVGKAASLLGGSPSNFRFIDRIGPYTIGCGHDNTEWKNSASNNPENWTTGDSGTANVKKGGSKDKISNMRVLKDRIFFFKGSTIEIWYNRGGSTPFVRIDIIEKGTGADYSIVKESNALYWFGDDQRFYRMDGNNPTVISSPYENYIHSFKTTNDCEGFNFNKEHLIKWQFKTEGKTLVYDYKNNTWSEDNHWEHGQFERLNIASYMQLNNKQYIGSSNNDGLVYEWGADKLDDAGKEIKAFRTFSVRGSSRGNMVVFNRLGLRFKRGVATGTVLTPLVTWRNRIDGGLWSDERMVDLGKVGDNNPYVEEFNLRAGDSKVGREIEIEISETDAVEYLMTNMDLTIRELNR